MSAIASPFWDIPQWVNPFYGRYRIVVQLAVFVSLALCTYALTRALLVPEAALFLRDVLTITTIIHGIASIYQYIAYKMDLPLIGISRAHEGIVSIAAFASRYGDIQRPGGLAGEPKTAAVVFGTYLLMKIFSPKPNVETSWRRIVELTAMILASVGFLMAFSTSAFIGFLFTIAIIFLKIGMSGAKTFPKIAIISLIAAVGWVLFASSDMSYEDLLHLVRLRTVERIFQQDPFDPPVAACIQAIRSNPWIALFGTGLGGSSFVV
ncbi:MAG: hypothetical protein FJ045_05200, partial [Crenarchaeota archaeon]|nr:hypothetical protein [Thermoproteota archaeon]